MTTHPGCGRPSRHDDRTPTARSTDRKEHAVATTTPAPYQPTDDNDARLAAWQILGSDIDHAWTGDWHQALQKTAARWAATTDIAPAA